MVIDIATLMRPIVSWWRHCFKYLKIGWERSVHSQKVFLSGCIPSSFNSKDLEITIGLPPKTRCRKLRSSNEKYQNLNTLMQKYLQFQKCPYWLSIHTNSHHPSLLLLALLLLGYCLPLSWNICGTVAEWFCWEWCSNGCEDPQFSVLFMS